MVSIIGIDIAKSVFQVCALDEHHQVLFNERLSRAKLSHFMHQQPQTRVVLEACYSSHYWARCFETMGHDVGLIPAQHVKPFVRGNKNDSNDALAIAEAARRPGLRFVPIKSVAQQEVLVLHRVRERLKRQRTQLTNQTRGLLSEFGIIFANGHKAFIDGLRTALADDKLSTSFKRTLQSLAEEYRDLSERLTEIDARIAADLKQMPNARLLMSIPGVGPLIASALAASIDSAQAFDSPRALAVWLGLTPRQYASGERSVTGGITKRGDRYLRTLLVHGARSTIRWAKHRDDALSQWINELVKRRGFNTAAVAIAHKLARIAWGVLHRQTPFKTRPAS